MRGVCEAIPGLHGCVPAPDSQQGSGRGLAGREGGVCAPSFALSSVEVKLMSVKLLPEEAKAPQSFLIHC